MFASIKMFLPCKQLAQPIDQQNSASTIETDQPDNPAKKARMQPCRLEDSSSFGAFCPEAEGRGVLLAKVFHAQNILIAHS